MREVAFSCLWPWCHAARPRLPPGSVGERPLPGSSRFGEGEQKALILGILRLCCAANTEALRALKMPHVDVVL